jgi:hypothetical protein
MNFFSHDLATSPLAPSPITWNVELGTWNFFAQTAPLDPPEAAKNPEMTIMTQNASKTPPGPCHVSRFTFQIASAPLSHSSLGVHRVSAVKIQRFSFFPESVFIRAIRG